jgi:hypothetical protein
MDTERQCTACGAALAGPFLPRIGLNLPPAEGSEEKLAVAARSWICIGCGLVHWYAEEEDLDKLMDAALGDDALDARPGTSYERRTQMLRMLRRVRRM